MKCPFCGFAESKVIDSRPAEEGATIRRRRECLEKIADEIEQELQSALEREITTEQVGEMVMKRLKDVDEVAYVRFASVYRQFKDIDTFMQELTKLLNDRG